VAAGTMMGLLDVNPAVAGAAVLSRSSPAGTECLWLFQVGPPLPFEEKGLVIRAIFYWDPN
jgi:hypothetical protein